MTRRQPMFLHQLTPKQPKAFMTPINTDCNATCWLCWSLWTDFEYGNPGLTVCPAAKTYLKRGIVELEPFNTRAKCLVRKRVGIRPWLRRPGFCTVQFAVQIDRSRLRRGTLPTPYL